MSDVPQWLADAGFVPTVDDRAWEPLLHRDLAVLDQLVRAVSSSLGALDDPWHDVVLPADGLTDAQRRMLEG